MAHYAFLDENNIVTEVISGIDENELIEGLSTEEWYGNFRNQRCVRTSYTSFGGNRIDPETMDIVQANSHFRKNYAGIGYYYDEERDAFIPPKLYPSWILDEDSCWWISPVPYPTDNNPKGYDWNEELLNWVEHNPEGFTWDEENLVWVPIEP